MQWLRPHAAGLNHAQRITLAASHEDTEAYSREGVRLAFAVDAAPRLRQSTPTACGFPLTSTTRPAAFATPPCSRASAICATTPPARRSIRADGSIVDVRLEPSVSAGDETLGFVRAIADGRIYHSFGDTTERHARRALARGLAGSGLGQ